jgi:AraC-like DNA-binding protein
METPFFFASAAIVRQPSKQANMSTNNQEEARKTSLENEKWLMRLELLLRINTQHPALSVPWMAEKLHISERQFARKTLLLTGNKPLDVIREARLQAAYELLLTKQVKSVKEAARILHFADLKYFSRLFYKRFGIYPGHLRRNGPLPTDQ